MKKILTIFLLLAISTITYPRPFNSFKSRGSIGQPHSFGGSHTGYNRHPHFSENYHNTSHGHNGFSQHRTSYYHLPILFFALNSPYHGTYHHYHIGNQKDTVFCSDSVHNKPIMDDYVNDNSGTVDYIIISSFIIITIGVIVWFIRASLNMFWDSF